jgi:hypothetical protein
MSKLQIIKLFLLIINCQLFIDGYTQDIPIGTWRSHISFNAVHTVSLSSNKVYAASANGIMIFDQTDNSLSTLTKLDGLSDTDISQIAVDQVRQQILVGYSNGNLDIIRAGEIINFDRLKTSVTVPGSKRINHVMVNGNFAHLSTDYGVVVFDLVQLEVKETWRDLGPTGTQLKIYQSTFFSDSIFLATEQGVIVGSMNDNLLDFNNWLRFETGAFNGDVQSITTFNNKVYAAINGSGIHRYENGTWTLEGFLTGLDFKNITTGVPNMLITEGNNLHSLSTANVITPITDDEIEEPIIAFEDVAGKVWTGDSRNGLVSNKTGSFESYVANGPSFAGGVRLKYNAVTDAMFAVSGGYNSGFSPLLNMEYLNFFINGSWDKKTLFADQDLTDIEVLGNKTFLSSYGKGIQVIENDAVIFQDETTTPSITALASSSAGIWVADYGTAQSLNLLKSDNTWESFYFTLV